MFTIITSTTEVADYLRKRQLVSQFQKAIIKLKTGNYSGLDFKKRKPENAGIWSFRINQKYRAWCRRKDNELTIYLIDDHQ